MTMWMPDLSTEGPRYRAIAEAIADSVADGRLAPGEKLPPQRRLADELGVTTGTITRAYAEAERRGWVEARVGSGTYVRSSDGNTGAHFLALSDARDGVIDLSLSLPPPSQLRAESLGRALRAITEDIDALHRSVEYQSEQGTPAHREQLAAWMGRLGMPVDPATLLITQGGQHGISLALHTLIRPGERIAADALTYPGLISAAQQAHIKVLGIPLDDEGMDVDALERICAQQPPRLVYVTPDQNNPTGIMLSETRRLQLAELARRHDFLILEDGVQYLPEAERGTPMHELAPERTLFLFSTAKILGGGMRIGAMKVPELLLKRMGGALRAQSWMVPPLMIETVCRWVSSGDAGRLLAWQTEELGARQRLARERLASFEIQGRPHGANLWLKLPPGLRSAAMQASLEHAGVRVTSAEPFCVGSAAAPQALRLCLSAAPSRDILGQALDRIAEALETPPALPWNTL
ncbi:PLP-dependent aminotransferase family protein [Marinobacter sp.]|uniref:aminotransferase-like domain-containing protein n=1 Tax=Marinobacter sp. TaxID=50741 RepID=UPI00384A9ABE